MQMECYSTLTVRRPLLLRRFVVVLLVHVAVGLWVMAAVVAVVAALQLAFLQMLLFVLLMSLLMQWPLLL